MHTVASCCSTGFGVHQSGHYFLLSADHCSERTTPYTIPYSGLVLGIPYSSFSTSDIFSIDTSYMMRTGVSSGNRIYAQGVDQSGGGANEINRVVRGVNSPVVGDLDCTSGGFSGERCNIKVINTNITINADGNIFQRMIQAEQTENVRSSRRKLLCVTLVGLAVSCGPHPQIQGGGTASNSLSALAQFLQQRYSGGPYGETFAGVALDEHADRVFIYRTVPSIAIDQDVGRLKDARVVTKPAKNAARRLQQISDAVAADRDFWKSKGITISTLSIRVDGSAVEVGVDPARGASTVASHYAGRPIEVVARRVVLA